MEQNGLMKSKSLRSESLFEGQKHEDFEFASFFRILINRYYKSLLIALLICFISVNYLTT